MQQMDKLKQMLGSVIINRRTDAMTINFGRKRFNITLVTFRELQAVIDALEWFQAYETINKDVAELCVYCDIPVCKSGVGYLIGKDWCLV
jgi:hypothetical protein